MSTAAAAAAELLLSHPRAAPHFGFGGQPHLMNWKKRFLWANFWKRTHQGQDLLSKGSRNRLYWSLPWSNHSSVLGRVLPGDEWFEAFHARSIRHPILHQCYSPSGIRQVLHPIRDCQWHWRRTCTGFWRQGIARIFSNEINTIEWNLSNCNGELLGKSFATVEMDFAPSWPIPWLCQPIHDGIDIFFCQSAINRIVVINFEPLGFVQLAAKQLLCQGECVLIAVQRMDAVHVQQWNQIGQNCAQNTQIYGIKQ